MIVLHESASVIGSALEALQSAAPRRGVRPIVVDNASTDDGAAIAARIAGESNVIRLASNVGFAGGVNAGLARSTSGTIALVNPDLQFEPGALDRMADALDAKPTVGLIGPLVRAADGSREATVGMFPTLAREQAHAWFLDRALGRAGRRADQPVSACRVDWISGCAWLLRREAMQQVGPLDAGYFMYVEDVDYARRLRDSGWEVWIEPLANALHVRGTGSSRSSLLPADGGLSLIRYFEQHASPRDAIAIRAVLRRGWSLRRMLHTVRGWCGSGVSARLALRYERALSDLAAGR